MSMNSHPPPSSHQHTGPIPQSPHLNYRQVPSHYQQTSAMINPMMFNTNRSINSNTSVQSTATHAPANGVGVFGPGPMLPVGMQQQPQGYSGSYWAHGAQGPPPMRSGGSGGTPQVQPTTEKIEVEGKVDGTREEITLTMARVCHDNGAFGQVFRGVMKTASEPHTQREVAIKKVKQEKRYRNRELELLRDLSHKNIVQLFYHYKKTLGDNRDPNPAPFLFLVMEFMPTNLNDLIRRVRNKIKRSTQSDFTSILFQIKVCMYQLFAALDYIHNRKICHRDIKPNNLLYNPNTGVLKLCDFGSAKVLTPAEPNVAYICARYYRAPELLFGSVHYTNKIDLWSTGVVFTECLQGEPLFHGDTGLDHLVVIISKLGTPTREELTAMNENYARFQFPNLRRRPMEQLFSPDISSSSSEAMKLLDGLFQYDPNRRLSAREAMDHPFFNELHNANLKWTQPDGTLVDLPPL